MKKKKKMKKESQKLNKKINKTTKRYKRSSKDRKVMNPTKQKKIKNKRIRTDSIKNQKKNSKK